MKIVRIPKGKGRFRVIYVPTEEEKKRALAWASLLKGKHVDPAGVQHGFRPGRSTVTNALAHRDWRYTISFDLRDFFDSVKPSHLFGQMNIWDTNDYGRFVEACFVDGAARQGLPTSPAIANLAAAPMDADIIALNEQSRLGWMFVYTRYADDLTFSFNYPGIGDMLRREVSMLAAKHGFEINTAKTHLQSARQGRRVITGVAVSDTGTHLPRSVKRKLRAITHQLKYGLRGRGLRLHIARQREHRRRGDDISLTALLQGQHRGLIEWAKLKLPDGYNVAPKAKAAAPRSTPQRKTTTTHTTPAVGQRKIITS